MFRSKTLSKPLLGSIQRRSLPVTIRAGPNCRLRLIVFADGLSMQFGASGILSTIALLFAPCSMHYSFGHLKNRIFPAFLYCVHEVKRSNGSTSNQSHKATLGLSRLYKGI